MLVPGIIRRLKILDKKEAVTENKIIISDSLVIKTATS